MQCYCFLPGLLGSFFVIWVFEYYLVFFCTKYRTELGITADEVRQQWFINTLDIVSLVMMSHHLNHILYKDISIQQFIPTHFHLSQNLFFFIFYHFNSLFFFHLKPLGIFFLIYSFVISFFLSRFFGSSSSSSSSSSKPQLGIKISFLFFQPKQNIKKKLF